MIKTIILSGKPIQYDLQKKKVKNVNIRIKSDLTVHVSAPFRVSQKEIEQILSGKSDFILSALQKYEKSQENARLSQKESGDMDFVTVFGKAMPITLKDGKRNHAEIVGNEFFVTLKDVNDKEALKKAIDNTLNKLFMETVTEICHKIYPKFENHLPYFPKIKFRRMKSRWGSCNYRKYILTFNYHLMRAPIDCVEYVIYHEFTHFIHPNHSKAFYLELSAFVPDHKIKKKELQHISIN